MTEPARNFQHYEVLRRADGSPWELGRGAMGVTYKAFDVNLCCEVALKVVSSALLNHPDARERFVREARAAAALRHRNVASVYHLGNDGEHFFYAMEFIDGETLDALVRRQGPLPVQAVLRVILQVAKALAAADRQHLVHRDIKPSNLMIVHEDADEDMTVKVIDFGLARPTADVDGAAPVTLGGFVGTPQYASPEQLEERPLDVRSDIYSLGVTAWYLLTGRPPFTGSLATVCQQQLGKVPPWESLPSGLPEGVRRLLGRMLEKDPGNRPQNARDLRTEIEACFQDWTEPGHFSPGGWHFQRESGSAHEAGKTPSAIIRETPLTILAEGRYTLVHLLDEGLGTRAYLARDEDREGGAVVVRTLPPDLGRDGCDQPRIREEIRLIQAAAHPNLVQIYSLAQATGSLPAFLVEEALAGFSLRDLLAARRGALPLDETLRLLEQSAAAADHADRCRLEHLDLALRRVRIHFPFAGVEMDGDDATRSLLPLPLEKWPAWHVKIHPFPTGRQGEALHTWAGDVTLIPGGNGSPRRPAPGAGAVTSHHLRSLAALTYELLGGAAGAGDSGVFAASRTIALPTLNEAGNAVLLEALSEGARFPDCQAFYESLADAASEVRAAGNAPARKTSALPPIATQDFPVDSGKARAGRDFTNGSPAGSLRKRVNGVAPAENNPCQGSTAFQENSESVADLFQPPSTVSPESNHGIRSESSAWERLAMAHGQPARPGRWLLGVMAAGLVFVCVFAGVLVALFHADRTKNVSGPIPGTRQPVNGALAVRNAAAVPARGAPNRRGTFRADGGTHPTDSGPHPDDHPSPPQTLEAGRDSSSAVIGMATATPSISPIVPSSPAPDRVIAVRLYSSRRGVEVRWRGRLLGITPTEAYLPPGEQEIVVNYPNGPETHQTVSLHADQPRAAFEIRPMSAELVPLNTPPPARGERVPGLNPTSGRRAGTGAPARIDALAPAAPPPGREAAPVRRPLPLEPFVNDPDEKHAGQTENPTPKSSDDDD